MTTKKKLLSRSLTWAELAAQSSTEQTSSAAEAAAWERVIGNARRGRLGGAEKRQLRKLLLLRKKRLCSPCLLFRPFFIFFLSRPPVPFFLDLVLFLAGSSLAARTFAALSEFRGAQNEKEKKTRARLKGTKTNQAQPSSSAANLNPLCRPSLPFLSARPLCPSSFHSFFVPFLLWRTVTRRESKRNLPCFTNLRSCIAFASSACAAASREPPFSFSFFFAAAEVFAAVAAAPAPEAFR